jgi:signal transduction histidine kinase
MPVAGSPRAGDGGDAMAEGFPTTPRVPTRFRVAAILIGLALLGLALHAIVLSLPWIGTTFPGFMVLDNRVVASVGLAHWTGSSEEGLKQSQIVSVDGRPVTSAQAVYDAVAAKRPGTPVTYGLTRWGQPREATVLSERFHVGDWLWFFGSFLLNGTVYLVSGLIVWTFRPSRPVARAFLSLGLAFALLLFSAVELYRPSLYFRLHVVGETWLWAAGFHLLLTFPYLHRLYRFVWVPYAAAGVVALLYEVFLYVPSVYSSIVILNYTAIGIAAVSLLVRVGWNYWVGESEIVRQRSRILLLGTLLGFAVPGLTIAMAPFVGGDIPMNQTTSLNFLFAVAVAYAILKHDLFEIDAMVKRGAYYALLTGAVGAAYVLAVLVFNLVLRAGAVTESPIFPVVFTLAVLLFFNPIRTRLQSFVDRVFYRTRYDSAQVLAEVGAALSSALTREHIGRQVTAAVDEAIPNTAARLFVGRGAESMNEVGGEARVPETLRPLLGEGRVLTSFDSAEAYADGSSYEGVREALGALGAEVAVPLSHHGELVGVLAVGPKRSGLFYTAGDAEFLRAMAHQAAIALENSRTYEELVELNASLERRVRERTEEVEASNRSLQGAMAELKAAEVQLVQSEKMASLGRLVAGIAHEINNPVSFIATSIEPLKRRLDRAAGEASPDIQKVLDEAQEIVDVMARGAERTATIVKGLRTFSRLHEASRKLADLNEGLGVNLRLLESRWVDRIVVHRDYGALPEVECDPGQMNQVFMNLLANACDALVDGGNLWIRTRADAARVTIEIQDDGCGMPAEVLQHVFDPFFTTKDVGQGTGLGLSISHGIVLAHGGTLEAESEPGVGTTFRITLPASADAASLDRVAGGN